MLVNLDQDSELEVVVHAGPVLTAYDIGQTVSVLWRLGGEGFVGQRQPLAADLDQDGDIEFLLASINDEIKVVSNAGSLLYTPSNASSVFIVGYSQTGNPLTSSGFPYILPEGVSAGGGIAIGDLDRDGKVEMVFGSNDCMLQCWELGSCTTGYLPCPQYQHDCGRSGVLE